MEKQPKNTGLDFMAKMKQKNEQNAEKKRQQQLLSRQAEREFGRLDEVVESPTSKLAYSATGNFVVRGNGQVEVAPTDHIVSQHVEKKEKSLQALNPDSEKFDDLSSSDRARLLREEGLEAEGDSDEYHIPVELEGESEEIEVHANKRREDRKAQMRTVEQDADYSEDDFGDFDDGEHLDTTMVVGKLKPDMGLRDNPKDVEFDDSVTVTRKEQ